MGSTFTPEVCSADHDLANTVVFTRESGRWPRVNSMIVRYSENAAPGQRIVADDFSATRASWRDLIIGGRRYRISTANGDRCE